MKKEAGFSLIELIIALHLFILLLLFIGTLIPLSQISARSTSHQDIAMTYAISMMDRIRLLPWESIIKDGTIYSGMRNDASPNDSYPPLPYPSIVVESRYPDPGTLEVAEHRTIYYFVVRALYEPDNPSNNKLINVTVSVYWNEHGRGEKELPGKRITLSSKMVRKL